MSIFKTALEPQYNFNLAINKATKNIEMIIQIKNCQDFEWRIKRNKHGKQVLEQAFQARVYLPKKWNVKRKSENMDHLFLYIIKQHNFYCNCSWLTASFDWLPIKPSLL